MEIDSVVAGVTSSADIAGSTTCPCPRPSLRAPDAARPLSMRKNFSWIVLGNSVRAASHWGILVVLAKLGSTEMIGLVALAFAVCTPVSGLMNLGLRGVLVTDARRQYEFADYLGLRIVTSVILLLVVGMLVLAAGYDTRVALIIMAVALGKAFEGLSDVFHGLLQQHERMDRIGVALMIRGPLFLMLLGLGVYLTGDVPWAIAAFPLALAVTFLGYDLPNGRRIIRASRGTEASFPGGTAMHVGLNPRFHPTTLAKLTWISLPLGLAAFLVGLNVSIPQCMIDRCLGSRDLGVFAALVYAATMVSLVVTAIGQSACPRLAKYYAAGNTMAYCTLLGKLLIVVTCLGIVLVLMMALGGRPLLLLLYDADVARHADLAVWVMAAAAVRYLCRPLARAIDAMRRFKTHLMIRTAGTLLLLALLPGLIGAHGLKGAAMAMLISATFLVVVYTITILSILGPTTSKRFKPVG